MCWASINYSMCTLDSKMTNTSKSTKQIANPICSQPTLHGCLSQWMNMSHLYYVPADSHACFSNCTAWNIKLHNNKRLPLLPTYNIYIYMCIATSAQHVGMCRLSTHFERTQHAFRSASTWRPISSHQLLLLRALFHSDIWCRRMTTMTRNLFPFRG